MKIGRFFTEYWPGLQWEFHRAQLHCGCLQFAIGPWTVGYVCKSSKCYPHPRCTHGRKVMFSCGHEFWSGWGIPQPELGEVCPRCKVMLNRLPGINAELHCSELELRIKLGKGNE